MSLRRLLSIASLAVTVGLPVALEAQDLTKVFTDIQRISVFGRMGGFTSSDNLETSNSRGVNRFGNAGLGIELGYNIRKFDHPDSEVWFYEAGVGYTQTGGFRLKGSDVDMRGTIRELPTLSFYAIRKTPWSVNPYFGISSGFSRLQNLNLYDKSGNQFTTNSETLTAGASLGLALANPAFSPFIEAGYRYRDFRSLDYKTANTVLVPLAFPRSLNFSGWHLDIGMQVGLDLLKGTKTNAVTPKVTR